MPYGSGNRPKGSTEPKGKMTPNAPVRAKKSSKVGKPGKDNDGSRNRYPKGLLSGKSRG